LMVSACSIRQPSWNKKVAVKPQHPQWKRIDADRRP
jgi:hypothetical protein